MCVCVCVCLSLVYGGVRSLTAQSHHGDQNFCGDLKPGPHEDKPIFNEKKVKIMPCEVFKEVPKMTFYQLSVLRSA